MKDKRLILKLKAKETKSLELIIENYSSYVYTVVKNVIGDYMSKEDIEEVVSDCFVNLWNSAEKIDHEKPLLPYLSAIARNTARNKFRKFSNEISLEEITYEPSMKDDIEELVENCCAVSLIYEAVELCKDTEKEIFIRFYFYGEKLEDIAKKTGLTLSNCKTKLFRIRKKIKVYLTERGYEYEK